MKLKSLLFFVVCCFVVPAAFAQTVNLQVNLVSVERQNYPDCTACGNPDPTWKITAIDNGSGSVLNGPICIHYDSDPNTIEAQNFTIWNVTNSNATQFTLGMNEAFEKNCNNNNCTFVPYNFFTCFPAVYGDANYCSNPNLAVVNFMDSTPCATHITTSGWCGYYRFTYSFSWTFNYAPTITVQPVPNTQLCIGTATTLSVTVNTVHGWSLGASYQWQVSSNTSCPGSNWTNIIGATASTYTPPQTGGTRLYRCLITSNCTSNFATNSVTSNCARVTYSPIGTPGDPVPPIISGICGSTVLPGSTNTLNILTPPTVGAVVGATGYSWTASGGAPTTGSSTSFTWTAPVNPGTYNINLTYLTNCPPNASASTCVVTVGSPTCSFAYVSPTGADSIYAGGPDVPYKSIAYALTQLSGRTKLRLAIGTYNESVPLNITNNLVFDGGYVINNGIWSKSNSDSTYIICSGTQVINNAVAHRVGFVSNGASNWELQDLVIKTTDIASTTTNGEGYSNYGVLAYGGSGNFKVIRTKIYAGSAANGRDGVTPGGSGGNGGHGNGGGGGNGAGKCSTGTNGTAGTGSTNGGGGAGGGGSTCSSSGCNIVGCGSNGCSAAAGTPGGNGSAGAGYVANARPASPAAGGTYYAVAAQSASGSAGTGGGGGGGGGGAATGSCCTCGCGSGSPVGGAGGNGGDGGLPGSGGWGGGGSFGIYASGAGTTGTIVTALVKPGNAGTGGNGANGQPASNAQGGAAGHTHGGCDGGVGGNGGNGGAGGNGGRGQDGANGISTDIVAVNSATISGSSTGVPNNYIVGINYNNAKACIYSEISLTKSTGLWTFPGSLNIENDVRDVPAGTPATTYNAGSSPIIVYTTTPNVDIDLTVNGLQYAAYLKIAPDVRQLPAVHISSHAICLNSSATLSATHWGTEQEYDWRVYQGASVNSPLYQSTLPAPTVDFTGYSAGTYIVRYKVRESCCGWSIPVYDTIEIVPLPIQYTVQGGGTYCPGGAGVPITLNGSEPGVKYVVYYNGIPVDSAIGTGASPLVFANETQVGIYTVTGFKFTGCGQNMLGFVNVGLSPTPTLFHVIGGGNACPGATAGPPIYLNGSQLGVSYQLFLNGTTPVGNPVQGTGNQIPFVNQGQAGLYTVVGTFLASPYCGAKMLDSVTISLIALPNAYTVTGGGSYCAGDSGRQIGLSGSDVSVTYSLYTAGVLAAGPIAGTGGPISFGTFTIAGSYNAIATNIAGCDTAMNNSVVIKPLVVPTITSVTYNDVSCFGGRNDTINIAASSADGAISYSVDNGLTYPNATGLFTGLPSGTYYIVVKDDSSCTTRYAANPVALVEPAAALAVNSVIVDITCNGANNGSLDMQASGGWGAYTYAWGGGQATEYISGLSAAVYSGTVTDIKGCRVVVSDTIHNPTPITSNIAGANVTCAGGNNGSAILTVNGGTPPYTYLWSNFAVTQNINNLAGGLYHVVITDAKGCTHEDSILVTEGLPVTATISSTNISCYGANSGSITVTPTGGTGSYNYTWLPNISTGATASNLAPGNYSITVSDGNSCSTIVSATITQPAAALSVRAIVTPTTCNNSNNGAIHLQVSGGTGAYTYLWTGGATTPDTSSLAAGIYTVTVTDANACTAIASGIVTNPLPITSSVAVTNVTCAGSKDGSAHLTVGGGTAPYTFLWSTFSASQNLDSLRGGTYFVIITDANGCEKRDSGIVQEALPIVVSDTVRPISCSGTNDASIHVIASGGTGGYTYTWAPTAPNSPDDVNLTAGTYSVTVSDGNGCSASISETITSPSQLSLSHVHTNPLCNSSTDGSITLLIGGGTPSYTYTWANSFTGSTVANVPAGTYYVTVSDAHGCSKSDSIVVTDPAAMYISGIPKNVTCKGNHDGQVIATGYGGTLPYNYQWYYDSLTGTPGPVTKDFTQLSGGDYYLVITDVNNCTVSYHAVIKEADSLKISLVETDATCQSANSGAVAVIVTGGVTPYQYLWNNFVTDSFQVNIPGGNYGVVVTDSNGCHQTKTVSVNGQPDPMTVNTAFNNPTCNSGTNGFISLDVLGGVQPYSYNWSTAPPQTGNLASDLTSGTYYVTITDSKGCRLIDSATLVSPPSIAVSTTIGVATCVSASDGFVVVNVVGGSPPYTYQLGNSIQSNDTIRNLSVGTYILTVRDVNGCQGATSLTVAATGYFTLDLTASPNYLLAGEAVQLHADAHSDTTVTAYLWNPLDSLNFQGCPDTTNCNDPIAYPRVTRTYVVTALNARGCIVSDTVLVTVSDHPSAFIPTAFTPNGDNLNDRFEFDILGCKSADVQIWNRWGEKVFSNPNQLNGINNPQNIANNSSGWDGSFRGKGTQYDSYTYQINVLYFDGHTERMTGTVVVMK